MLNKIGGRKFTLGMTYLIGGLGLLTLALYWQKDAATIAALASAYVAMAPGLGVIVWGNVQAERARNGTVEK
jgi:hypothetical protein